LERAAAGRGEPVRGARGELPDGVLIGVELQSVPAGPLEVVADDLLKLGDARPRTPLEPARQALVQIGAERFGQPPVRSVVDERMLEAVAGLSGEDGAVRVDEALVRQRVEMPRS
jgi:hypothetical protein